MGRLLASCRDPPDRPFPGPCVRLPRWRQCPCPNLAGLRRPWDQTAQSIGAQPRAPPWSAAPACRLEKHRHLAWQQCLLAAPLVFVRTESVSCPLGHPSCPLSSTEEGAWMFTGVVVCPDAWLAGTHVGTSPGMFNFKASTAASVLPVSRNVPRGTRWHW